MRARFFLTGLAAELSLRPLERALRDRGLPVALVDLADAPAVPAAAPPGDGPLVLVTSQHTLMTGAVYDDYTGLRSHYVAPQVLKRTLGAELMVYVPHDLSEPVLESEIPLLRLFDLYAAPDADAWWARAHVPTVVCGWVGTAGPEDPRLAAAPLASGVLFVSSVRWLSQLGGGAFVLRTLEHTLSSGIAVKLPVWPGLETMTEQLARAGVPLIAPELATSTVVRHTPLVVTNAPSSVLAEAALAGHRPLCVLHPEGDHQFRTELGDVDVIACRDEEFAERVKDAGRVRAPGPAFDVDALLAAIQTQLEDRRD
jgi:hypothetical protein